MPIRDAIDRMNGRLVTHADGFVTFDEINVDMDLERRIGDEVAGSVQRTGAVIMKRVSVNLVVAGFIAIMSVPSPARADSLFVPWLGANTGNQNVSGVVDFGASVGTMIDGVIGVDLDFGYSPDFFGNGLNSYVLTTMGNVTVGIPFDRGHAAGIRPYVTGGIGLIRASIDSRRFGLSVANNDVGVNVGGGVMGFFGEHVGVRGDLRYLRSLEDDNSTNPFNQFDLARLHYWRTSFGVVLR